MNIEDKLEENYLLEKFLGKIHICQDSDDDFLNKNDKSKYFMTGEDDDTL